MHVFETLYGSIWRPRGTLMGEMFRQTKEGRVMDPTAEPSYITHTRQVARKSRPPKSPRRYRKPKSLKRDLRRRALHQKLDYLKKLKAKCALCPESDQCCLDFHHVDPSLKRARCYNLARYSWRLLRAELVKCVVLCANCHRKEHKRLKSQSGGGLTGGSGSPQSAVRGDWSPDGSDPPGDGLTRSASLPH
jgi:hypothetical protein